MLPTTDDRQTDGRATAYSERSRSLIKPNDNIVSVTVLVYTHSRHKKSVNVFVEHANHEHRVHEMSQVLRKELTMQPSPEVVRQQTPEEVSSGGGVVC